tara:strand:- start:28246 stop:28650 length:405 start_codon:yes stop_codon:yes gene_type:complete
MKNIKKMKNIKIARITWEEVYLKINTLKDSLCNKQDSIYGIPGSGQVVSGLTGLAVDSPEEANIIVDCIYDEKTYKRWQEKFPKKEYCFLFNKQFEHQEDWIVLPWEEAEEVNGKQISPYWVSKIKNKSDEIKN